MVVGWLSVALIFGLVALVAAIAVYFTIGIDGISAQLHAWAPTVAINYLFPLFVMLKTLWGNLLIFVRGDPRILRFYRTRNSGPCCPPPTVLVGNCLDCKAYTYVPSYDPIAPFHPLNITYRLIADPLDVLSYQSASSSHSEAWFAETVTAALPSMSDTEQTSSLLTPSLIKSFDLHLKSGSIISVDTEHIVQSMVALAGPNLDFYDFLRQRQRNCPSKIQNLIRYHTPRVALRYLNAHVGSNLPLLFDSSTVTSIVLKDEWGYDSKEIIVQ